MTCASTSAIRANTVVVFLTDRTETDDIGYGIDCCHHSRDICGVPTTGVDSPEEYDLILCQLACDKRLAAVLIVLRHWYIHGCADRGGRAGPVYEYRFALVRVAH